jgi:hypothetical protein
MPVDPAGQPRPMPQNADAVEQNDMAEHNDPPEHNDVAEHNDAAKQSESAAPASSPSPPHEAEVAAEGGAREQLRSAPTTFEHHQMVLSFVSPQKASAPVLSFCRPASTTIPTRKENARCALCVQALCGRRFDCNGRVNRGWCKCDHPALVGGKKVRWSEAEIEHRIALRDAGEGSSHA